MPKSRAKETAEEGSDLKRETPVRSVFLRNPFMAVLFMQAVLYRTILLLPVIRCQTIFTGRYAACGSDDMKRPKTVVFVLKKEYFQVR